MEPCCGLAVRRRGDFENDFIMKHGKKVLLKKSRKEEERLLIGRGSKKFRVCIPMFIRLFYLSIILYS
jgi:hypothetical protein